MAQTIQLKRSSVAGNLPTSSDLALGEIAINTADGAVYIKKGNNDIVAVADNDILHIDTTNSRIGIGTTSPVQPLHVHTSSNSQMQFTDNASGSSASDGLRVGWNGSVGQVFLFEDADLRFATNNVERMRIKSDGKVGIGVSSPNRKLHIAGSGSTIAVKAEATDGNQSSLDLKNSEGEFRLINDGGSLFVYDQTDTAERFRINTSGVVSFNGAYSFPTADGSANQVLQTDGSGNLSFATVQAGGGGTVSEAFKTIAVSGQSNVVAEAATDTLTFVAGAGMTITTNASSDTVTFASGTSFEDSDGDTKIQVEESSDEDVIRMDTAGTERVQVTSNGINVVNSGGYRIAGTEVINSSRAITANGLTVDNNNDIQINRGGTSSAKIFWNRFGTTDAKIELAADENLTIGVDEAQLGSKSLIFRNNALEAMRIDSSQRVGIGTTSPSEKLHISGSSPSGDISARIVNTDISAALSYAGISLVGGNNEASIRSIHGTAGAGALAFFNENSEAMRIDNSGNLLVGQTAANSNSVGTSIRADGRNFFCVDGNYSAHFNRKSSDGNIVLFAKDDTVIGAIGVVASNNLFIRGDNVGIGIGDDNLYPTNSSGASTSGALDIGDSSAKFRNLHLSGTISSDAHTITTTGSGDVRHFFIDGADANYDFRSNSTSGYTTTFNMDNTGLEIGHNSSGRNLSLKTAGTDRLSISGSGTFTFHSNNLQSIGTISSGAITVNTNGRIGTAGGETFIAHNGSTDAGLRFRDGGAIIPASFAGTGTNGVADLGQAAFKFRNLHLSGTIASGAITSSAGLSGTTITSSGLTTVNSLLVDSGGITPSEVEGREFKYYLVGQGTDQNFKKVADVTISTGLYKSLALRVVLESQAGNFGNTVAVDKTEYVCKFHRSDATQDNVDAAQISGQDPAHHSLRIVKTATGVYELQVKQNSNYKDAILKLEVLSTNGGGISIQNGSVNGSTSGSIITPGQGASGATYSFNQVDTGFLKIDGTATIDSSRNFSNIGTISSGAITSSSDIKAAGDVWVNYNASGNEYLNLNYATSGDGGILFRHNNTLRWQHGATTNTGNRLFWYSYPASQEVMSLTTDGLLSTDIGYQVNGTTVIDSSRNLTNIGTITASGKITSTELTITGGTDSEDIYINNTSPTLGFTDSNSFSDSNDVYLIRGASTGKLQFQFKDDSAGTTTQTFLIDQSGNVDIAGTISSGTITSSGNVGAATMSTTGDTDFGGRGDFAKDLRIRGDGSTANAGVVRFSTNSNHLLMIDPANDGNNAFTFSSSGDLTVPGNLTVNGDTITANVATLDVEDKNITLNKGSGDTSSTADGAGITIQDAVNSSTDASLTWNAAGDKFIFSHKLRMFGNFELPDNVKLIAGDGEDLQIFHNGSNTKISHTGTGGLYIGADTLGLQKGDHSENYLTATADGAVNLFYNNVKKFETAAHGIQVTSATGYIEIKSSNASYAHIQTDRPSFYFNTKLSINTGIVTSYDEDFQLQRAGTTKLTLGSSLATFADGVLVGGDITIPNNTNLNFLKADGTNDGTRLTRAGGNALRLKYTGNSFVVDALNDNLMSYRNSDDEEYIRFIPHNDPASSSLDFLGSLRHNTTTLIDSSRNLLNIGTITNSGNISSLGNITVGNSTTARQLRAHYSDGAYMTLTGFGLEMNRSASYIRPTTDNDKTLYIGGADATLDWNTIHMRSGNGLFMNGTQFIDGSRNITNTGSISASGTITTTSGSPSRFNGGIAVGSDNDVYFYESSAGNGTVRTGSSGAYKFTTFQSDGDFNVQGGGLRIGSTQVITSARNLTNIGTISSGAITSSGTGTFVGDGAVGPNALNLLASTNGNGVGITFTDNGSPPAANSGQRGQLLYYHGDSASYGSGNAFVFSSTESTATILADGKLMFKEGLFVKPSSGTGAGTQIIDSSRNLLNIGTITTSNLSTASNTFTVNTNTSTINSSTTTIGNDLSDDIRIAGSASSSHLRIQNGIRGFSKNYADSSGWVKGTSGFTSQTGYYGGNFGINGSGTEQSMDYGTVPDGSQALIWTATGDTSNNADGGWNKGISGLRDDATYMSVVYVRRNSSSTSGNFYHGCNGSHTLNLNGTANTNPYFKAISISTLPQDVWCVSIGFIRANNNSSTAEDDVGGVYRCDTGELLTPNTTFKMKDGSTEQTHRTYLYYATSGTSSLSWFKPGFYEVNGSEPTVRDLVNPGMNQGASFGGNINLTGDIFGTNNFDIRSTGNIFNTYGNSDNIFFRTQDATTTASFGRNLVDLFSNQNGTNELKLDNNRQDLSNVPVSKVSGYNSVEVANMTFYRGSGGATGYIRFQSKYDNSASLTDMFQIGSNTNAYGVDVRSGGYRVNGTEVITASRNLTNIGTISTSGNIDAGGRVKVTNWIELESSGASLSAEEAGLRWDYNDNPLWYFYKDNANDGALHIQSAATSGESDATPRVRFHRTARQTYFGGAIGINKYSVDSGLNLDVAGAAQVAGTTTVGGSDNISMTGGSLGQLRIAGSGYTGAIALDGNAMHIYHNSSGRNLVFGTNETARLTINAGGAMTFHGNNLQSVGTISSGNINVGVSDTAGGVITVHGNGTGNNEGGEIRLQTAADHDSTYDFYRLDVVNDDFRIGRAGTTDFYIFQDGLVKAENNFQAGGTGSFGNVVSALAYQVSGTQVIDSSRNMSNIGTISSGKITATSSNDQSSTGCLNLNTSGTSLRLGGNTNYSWIQSHLSKPLYINELGNNVILNRAGGSVAIGHTSPAQKLDVLGAIRVNSAADRKIDFLRTGGNHFAIEHDTNQIYFYNHTTSEAVLTLRNNGDIRMTGGNVGVGTDSPTQKLDVRGGSGSGTHTHAIFTGTNSRGLEIRTRSDTAGGQHSGTAELNAADTEGSGGDLAFSSGGTIRMFMDGSGQFGIGTTAPSEKLDVRGDSRIDGQLISNHTNNGDAFIVQKNGTTVGKLKVRNASSAAIYFTTDADQYISANNGSNYMEFFTNNTENMRLTSTGDLHVEDDVIAFSTTVSDEKLKDNVVTIESALDKVMSLRGVEYIWNKGSKEGQKDLGVIAQEVEKVLPEIVKEKEMALIDGKTYKTVDYEKLTAVLIEAVKEQQEQIEKLKEHSHPAKDMSEFEGYQELMARIENMENKYGNN